MPQRILRTARLVLRPPVLADAEAIFQEYGQDQEVTRYLIWRPHQTLEETQVFVRGCIDAWSGGSRYVWVITRAADSRVLGMMDTRVESGFRVSVGYVLARDHWGQGIMPEALQAVVDLFWSDPAVFRIWAICDVENPASARVLEKIGMVREGTLRRFVMHPNISPEPRDAYCYALTR
jgi:[ribosomal protein S5]-alanine N-acetyltransferase